MRTDKPRELRKIASINSGCYRLIGFYITGSLITFKSIKKALKYAKTKGWKVTNPLKIKE